MTNEPATPKKAAIPFPATLRRGLAAVAALSLLLFAGTAARAQQQPDMVEVLRGLDFKAGSIALGDNLASIEQTPNFRYLNPADTQTFLTKIWGNPPGAGKDALGLILPADVNPLGEDGWAVLITYDASGYVSDEEAGEIDYAALMKEMKEAVAEASKERVQQGYDKLELLGWAKQPYYDPKEKKLYWAKRLRFGDSPAETLNYEIRILGRKGVLDLTVIAPMQALPQIDERVSSILSMAQFNKGNTYGEFDASTDDVAAYGLAGLIAGGVLTKAGFFKGLIALLIASKKLVGVALIAAIGGGWAGLKAFFRRRSSRPSV